MHPRFELLQSWLISREHWLWNMKELSFCFILETEFLCSVDWSQTHYVAEDGFEILVVPSLSSWYLDIPGIHCHTWFTPLGIEPRASHTLNKY